MSGLRRALPVLVLCLLTACSGSGGGGGTEPSRDASASASAEVERVLAELRSAPGVVEVSGGYSDELVDTGSVDIGLTVAETVSPAEREGLLDRAEELVWRSGVEPLEVVNVVMGTPGSAELVGERLYQGATQLQELERRYGPRPG